MKRIRGDLIALAKAGKFDAIVHGCNCFCGMGKGIAKVIKEAFPEAYEADRRTGKGDESKMGTISTATCNSDNGTCDVINAYIQFRWSGSGSETNYDALRSCFAEIKKQYSGRRIGIPKIGAGLAGGDWAVIAKIVDEEMAGEDITLVELPGV